MCATFAGSADSFLAQSRQREANESDSSTTERSARAATRWVHGPRSADPHAAWRRSVRPTPCGGPPSVRSAILPGGETERQRSVASGKWPCSRLLPMSWPGEASRPTAVSSATGGASRRIAVSCPCEASRAIAGLLVGRSLATISVLLFRGRTTFSDCLASLRPSERSESAPPVRAAPAFGGSRQRSGAGAKLASQSSCAGETVPILGSASVGSVKPGCCLFLTRSEATRFQCLTPRLKSSANLNGWNARMTSVNTQRLYARAV